MFIGNGNTVSGNGNTLIGKKNEVTQGNKNKLTGNSNKAKGDNNQASSAPAVGLTQKRNCGTCFSSFLQCVRQFILEQCVLQFF